MVPDHVICFREEAQCTRRPETLAEVPESSWVMEGSELGDNDKGSASVLYGLVKRMPDFRGER